MSGARHLIPRISFVLCAVIASFLAPPILVAQQATFADSAHVLIVSEPDGAEVYADSVFLGVTPLRVDRSERKPLHVFYPKKASFLKELIVMSGAALTADRGVVRLTFHPLHRIESDPAGASVYVHDSLIGATPLESARIASGDTVLLRRDGFVSASFRYGGGDGPLYAARLRPADGTRAQGVQTYRSPFSGLDAAVLLPATVGIGATIAAIVFKQKANAYYEDYQATYAASAYDNSVRYDLYSGLSIVVTQTVLGYFLYLLFR